MFRGLGVLVGHVGGAAHLWRCMFNVYRFPVFNFLHSGLVVNAIRSSDHGIALTFWSDISVESFSHALLVLYTEMGFKTFTPGRSGVGGGKFSVEINQSSSWRVRVAFSRHHDSSTTLKQPT